MSHFLRRSSFIMSLSLIIGLSATQVQYAMKEFRASRNGAEFTRKFPVTSDAWTPALKARIQKIIGERDSAREAERFFKEREDYVKTMTIGTSGWYFNEVIEVHYESAKVLTLSIFRASFEGGAHPWIYTQYINLRRDSGRAIQLKDVFAKSSETELKRLITEQLRKQAGVPEGKSMLDAGFHTNTIELTPNFAIGPDGLLFNYDETIASHADGKIVVELPYGAIRSLLRPDASLP